MRLFVKCPSTKKRIYLSINVESRRDLPKRFSIKCPYESAHHEYKRIDVCAEPEKGTQVGGALLGGLIGLVGGPLGLVIGGLAGAFLGDRIEKSEASEAHAFNQERI